VVPRGNVKGLIATQATSTANEAASVKAGMGLPGAVNVKQLQRSEDVDGADIPYTGRRRRTSEMVKKSGVYVRQGSR